MQRGVESSNMCRVHNSYISPNQELWRSHEIICFLSLSNEKIITWWASTLILCSIWSYKWQHKHCKHRSDLHEYRNCENFSMLTLAFSSTLCKITTLQMFTQGDLEMEMWIVQCFKKMIQKTINAWENLKYWKT